MTACANNKVFSRHRYEYIFSPTVNNKKPGVVFNDAEAIEAIARAGRPWPNEVIAVPNRPGSYQIRVIYRGDGEDLTKGTFCQFQGIYGRRGSCRVGTSYHFHTIQFGMPPTWWSIIRKRRCAPRAGPAAYRLRVSVANPDSRTSTLQRHRVAAERLMPKNASSGGHLTGGSVGNTLFRSGMARPGCAADRGDLVLG
jgi:hypothetical protein